MNTRIARQECATPIIFVHYVRAELQADAAPMLSFTGRGDTKFKLPKAGNGNVFFPNKRVRFARADKAVALQYHNQ